MIRALVRELTKRHRDDGLTHYLQVRPPERVVDTFERRMVVAHAIDIGADVGLDQLVPGARKPMLRRAVWLVPPARKLWHVAD